jgi:hypothetical protein
VDYVAWAAQCAAQRNATEHNGDDFILLGGGGRKLEEFDGMDL